MRRGGRMVYAFNVAAAATPPSLLGGRLPEPHRRCRLHLSEMRGIGQTWSTPSAAYVLGYNSGADPW
jgi:type IV pilus assembly protein PilY1